METSYDYNFQASLWSRDEPKYISDFVARPRVFDKVESLGGVDAILDAGCGEGYFTRKIKLSKLLIYQQ